MVAIRRVAADINYPSAAGLPILLLRFFARLAMIVSLVLCFSSTALSDEVQDVEDSGGGHWGLGIGGVATRSPYRGMTSPDMVIPVVVYESRLLRIYGPSVNLSLPKAGPVSLSVAVRWSAVTPRMWRDGYQASDSLVLAGMGERKDKVWMGGVATWHSAHADVAAELMRDVSGDSKGLKLNIRAEHVFLMGRVQLAPTIGATWLDPRYVAYYYGVKMNEMRADRPAYDPGGAIVLELGLRASYEFTQRDALFFDASTSRLGASIRSSPLVDKSNSSRITLGYLHMY